MDSEPSWRERRREAAVAQAAALEHRRATETAQARALLTDFVGRLRTLGIDPGPLRAQAGGTSYRTGLIGWYLRRNRSLGVDADANFYVLTAASSLASRLRGVRIEPSDPPLTVGLGARDGESFPLRDLLQRRLDELDAD